MLRMLRRPTGRTRHSACLQGRAPSEEVLGHGLRVAGRQCCLRRPIPSPAWAGMRFRGQPSASSLTCTSRLESRISTASLRGRINPSSPHFERSRLMVNKVVPVIWASSSRESDTSTPTVDCFPTCLRSLRRAEQPAWLLSLSPPRGTALQVHSADWRESGQCSS